MKMSIEFDMDNAAFEVSPSTEAARILLWLAERIDDDTDYVTLFDINGNGVGTMEVTE